MSVDRVNLGEPDGVLTRGHAIPGTWFSLEGQSRAEGVIDPIRELRIRPRDYWDGAEIAVGLRHAAEDTLHELSLVPCLGVGLLAVFVHTLQLQGCVLLLHDPAVAFGDHVHICLDGAFGMLGDITEGTLGCIVSRLCILDCLCDWSSAFHIEKRRAALRAELGPLVRPETHSVPQCPLSLLQSRCGGILGGLGILLVIAAGASRMAVDAFSYLARRIMMRLGRCCGSSARRHPCLSQTRPARLRPSNHLPLVKTRPVRSRDSSSARVCIHCVWYYKTVGEMACGQTM